MNQALRRLAALVPLLATLLLSSCGKAPDVTIVAGSENQVLEPIVMAFCRSRNTECHMKYMGSLDIALGLKPVDAKPVVAKPGNQDASPDQPSLDADAVWPASSIWIDALDSGRRVTSAKSIAQMPVILGVRMSKARELGWIGKPVTSKDILAAVDAHKLGFLMTSATQSNSGAMAYLAMLSAGLGKTDPLTRADLDNQAARDAARRMLQGVVRSAGSSGWLADLYRDVAIQGTHYDAMWNYEAVINETNDQLRAAGQEPLYAIYPADGVAIADSPLGFIDRGRGPEVAKFFADLQAYLLGDAQPQIAATGRRVGIAQHVGTVVDRQTNLDTTRAVIVLRPPEPAVIEAALTLYQEVLRRPSLTAICLDLSGSMQGTGERQLSEAMQFLLTPARTRKVLVQWLSADRIILLPFNDQVLWDDTATGADADQARLLQHALTLRAGGGTDFYTCAADALRMMKPTLDAKTHLPAIVIMTDGQSQGAMDTFERPWRNDGARVPVFGITFGDQVDRTQLDNLARLTGGRVFDGTKSLSDAFRAVRGYN